jgi:hypothetical protein
VLHHLLLSYQVRQLEHGSAIASAAFEAQVAELSDALAAATAQVADLTQERDALTQVSQYPSSF